MQPRFTLILVSFLVLACSPPPHPTLTLIDVGYGVAVLLNDGGTALLMDGGYAEESDELESQLHRAGIESLAVLIASHGHDDHLDGLIFLLENGWPVGTVAGNVEVYDERFKDRFWHILTERAIPYTRLRAGDDVMFGTVRCEVLHPDTLTRDRNESSMAARFHLGNRTVLIPSDITRPIQRHLAETTPSRLTGDIVVLPHHGDLVDPLFLDTVAPRYALLSVGPNPWNLPAQKTISELLRRNIRLLDTRTLGTITVSLEPDRISVIDSTGPGDAKRRESDMDDRLRRWAGEP